MRSIVILWVLWQSLQLLIITWCRLALPMCCLVQWDACHVTRFQILHQCDSRLSYCFITTTCQGIVSITFQILHQCDRGLSYLYHNKTEPDGSHNWGLRIDASEGLLTWVTLNDKTQNSYEDVFYWQGLNSKDKSKILRSNIKLRCWFWERGFSLPLVLGWAWI